MHKGSKFGLLCIFTIFRRDCYKKNKDLTDKIYKKGGNFLVNILHYDSRHVKIYNCRYGIL